MAHRDVFCHKMIFIDFPSLLAVECMCGVLFILRFSFGSNLFFKNLLFLSIFHFVCQVCQNCIFCWVFVMKTGQVGPHMRHDCQVEDEAKPSEADTKNGPLELLMITRIRSI